MTDDNKTSNLIIFGIAALATMFFAYLIYTNKNQQPTQPVQQTQPIQQPSIDTSLLYRLEFQTQQISDNIKSIQDQQKILQEQQMIQSQSVSQLEAAKCNNVVSMSNNDNTSSLKPLTISQMKKLPTNKTRESEEEIANRYFGMT